MAEGLIKGRFTRVEEGAQTHRAAMSTGLQLLLDPYGLGLGTQNRQLLVHGHGAHFWKLELAQAISGQIWKPTLC